MGELDEDVRLETTRARFSNVLKRHGELAERLSRYKLASKSFIQRAIRLCRKNHWREDVLCWQQIYCYLRLHTLVLWPFSGDKPLKDPLLEFDVNMDSDKMIFERLQKEFETARASQTQEICLDGDQWNDGLLATIRERVHMEAERKAMQAPGEIGSLSILPFNEKITYKVGTKVICCLEGTRIGIQYETSFAGEPCELYHCVLESKSFLEKMTVLEHTVPFFLPIRDAENDLLSSNAMKFIDHVGDLLQAYVDRREQVRLIKELYGNQIGELYHSLPYHMVEFILDDYDCKVTVSLRYADLVSILPTRISVVAWPMPQSKKSPSSSSMATRKGTGSSGTPPVPVRLSYAEEALRTMSLPEAYAEIVLNLPEALQHIHVTKNPSSASSLTEKDNKSALTIYQN